MSHTPPHKWLVCVSHTPSHKWLVCVAAEPPTSSFHQPQLSQVQQDPPLSLEANPSSPQSDNQCGQQEEDNNLR